MNNLIKIILLFSLSPALYADYYSERYIPGIRVIQQYADIKKSSGTISQTSSDSGNGLGLYVEKYYDNSYRQSSSLSYVVFNDFDIIGLNYSADYLFPMNDNISLFSGLSLGMAIQKYNNTSISNSSFGFNYGVQFGAMNFINENIMLELAFLLKLTNLTTEIDSTPASSNTINSLSEINFNILLMF